MEKYLLEKLYLQQNFQAFQQYIVETIQFFCFQHHPTMQSFTQNTHKMMMMQRKIIELRKNEKKAGKSIHSCKCTISQHGQRETINKKYN